MNQRTINDKLQVKSSFIMGEGGGGERKKEKKAVHNLIVPPRHLVCDTITRRYANKREVQENISIIANK